MPRRKRVPMGRIPWDITEPGHFEVDLVYHSGETTAGLHGHTIQLIDVATGWSERVAVLGRAQRAMEEGFEHILGRLPFAVQELHPDNGSEFFNHHLVRYWKDKVSGVHLSRSRPWHKNDNRMVEQKNDTLVREYLGDLRLDTPEQIAALNALVSRRCGSTTICFSRSCTCVRKPWSVTKCGGSGMPLRRLMSASWPLVC